MIPVFKCRQCRHKWIPRKAEPKACPKCHSVLWKRKAEKSGRKPKFITCGKCGQKSLRSKGEGCVYCARKKHGVKAPKLSSLVK